jgi:hypothetical protein
MAENSGDWMTPPFPSYHKEQTSLSQRRAKCSTTDISAKCVRRSADLLSIN